MKSFLYLFKDSAAELKKVSSLTVTGIFIAISMLIETFTIEIPYAKLNFAFLAIAVIGMLFGPTVSFIAGGLCDVVGFIVHPDGGFLPIYILIAMLQGLIYGVCLYRKSPWMMKRAEKKGANIAIYICAVIARLLDVAIINLLLNTKANMHYGFIPETAFWEAVAARLIKNVVELAADIPLLFILLPFALVMYKRAFASSVG
ncbi:MAG: folate family ECF transporter S component [Ruminococcus sp.]|nr:folate family ECF transporter S component [Ruminococcus sp.]MCD7726983.1 folate family ECF transporter S component [Ruminococcus sp.]